MVVCDCSITNLDMLYRICLVASFRSMCCATSCETIGLQVWIPSSFYPSSDLILGIRYNELLKHF